ncbi:hypothetical protein F4604DRAFT_1927117 [Suillus subluteus]|nr:hypothetical protein F4604DRAFT_1927117 [Suillus subluteus]
MNHFERASDLCPMDHPHHPAALLNLAAAKFVSCQADGRHLDLDIPLHLTIALQSCFAKQGFQMDADAARELLSKVLDVCHANSHIYRAALIAIETFALYPAESIDANDLGQQWPATLMLALLQNQLAD